MEEELQIAVLSQAIRDCASVDYDKQSKGLGDTIAKITEESLCFHWWQLQVPC